MRFNFPDLTVKAGSLKSILAGGLTFTTPDPKAAKVPDGHRFRLFTPQIEEKERYAAFEVWSPERHDIREGTPLLYKGFAVGKVKRVTLANNIIRFDMLIQKAYTRLLRPDSKIWLKTFQADLEGVKNTDTLLKGPALVITPGRAEGREHSFLLSSPPPPTYGKPGLRVTLEGDRLSSLSPGAPVYYRQVPIGSVESYRLSDDGKYVRIGIYIEPRYAHLVRQKSRFYIAGALGMDVGLTGIKIKTETLETLIRGGIGLAVPEKPGPVAEEGTLFRLYNEPKKKWLAWRPGL
jgi:paraquat-inducible protein B